MLDESNCHLRGIGSFCHFILFLIENPENKNVDPDQMACLPMTLLQDSPVKTG